MKKKVGYLFTATAALALAACGNDLAAQTEESSSKATSESTAVSSTETIEKVELETADALDIAHAQNNKQTLTYNQSTPITLPNGETIVQGDLKPVWQYISDELGFQISDKALQDATASEYIELQATTGFTESDIYSGEVAASFMRYGQEGYFVNLSERLDDMPNVKKFFEDNPSLLKTVTAPDGGVYHLPYVPELGYHSMVFFGRPDWVTTLLDAEEGLETETETVAINYEGFWDNRHDDNVAKLQNEAAQGGQLDRDTALQVLKDYIKETYPDLEKPSDLYLGEEAQYDMDEIVALWRVIKASPNTLSKVATGEVVEGAITTPFFVRSIDHTNYLLRMINYFGGQVGGDTSSAFYVQEDGKLGFSWNDPGAIDAYTQLREIFAEGLIYPEIANTNNEDNFRDVLFGSDENGANTQFGFMTLDWIASTAAASDKIEAMLPPMTTFLDDKEFVHYSSGYRPLNPFGMAVSAASSEEEINAALTLFDYIFSEEGSKVLNFGTPDMWEEGEVFTGPDGAEYPKMGDWLFDQAAEYSNNDLMTFMKYFLGANLQIAYPKSIGAELQFTNDIGLAAWDLYQNNDILLPSYDAENIRLKATPSIWPVSEQQQARLGQTNIGTEQRDNLKLYIFNSSAGPQSEEEIVQMYEDGNIDTYMQVYQEMYDAMEK